MPQEIEPPISQGAKDFLRDLLLKSVTFNFLGDRAKLKAFIIAGGEWAKTIATLPGDLDDYAVDKIIDLIEVYVDSYKEQAQTPAGPVIVGAVSDAQNYSVMEATSYMSGFSAAEVPEISRQKVLANPKVLRELKGLSRKNQIKVLNSQNLLDMLIEYGPFVLKIVLFLITLI